MRSLTLVHSSLSPSCLPVVPQCRQFTPILAQFHKDLAAQGKPFQVVFMSADHDGVAFTEYFKSMPWLAVPWVSTRRILSALSAQYDIAGYPTLVLLDPSGNVLTRDGRGQVHRGTAAYPFAGVVDPPPSWFNMSLVFKVMGVLWVLWSLKNWKSWYHGPRIG